MALTKEQKNKVMKEYRTSQKDTGSSEVQIALLTERINGLSKHFETNKKDHHSRFGLIKMVSRRKKLLKYVQSQDPAKYQEVISRLDLRK